MINAGPSSSFGDRACFSRPAQCHHGDGGIGPVEASSGRGDRWAEADNCRGGVMMSLVNDLANGNICSMDQLALYLDDLPFDAVVYALEAAGLAEEVMEAVNAQPEDDDDDDEEEDEE
jgi:hypothetical protein